MTVELWSAYVAAVIFMMITPGPSQLLMMSNSMANGFRRSLSTAAGDLSANVLQMLAAAIGLGAVVHASEHAFTVIKWLGAAYLVWMGVSRIRGAGRGRGRPAARASVGTMWLQGFVTSAANPRAVVFFAALFPQFISAQAPLWKQFAILSVTYVVIDGAFLCTYGGGAAWFVSHMTAAGRAWLDRVSGGFLVAAGVALGLKAVPR